MIFTTLIQTLIAILVLYTLYKFVFIALLKLRFYKKQGLLTQYSPVLGSFITKMRTSLSRHNDALYDIKEMTRANNKPKAIVRNFGATPVVIFLDNALKKEFAFHHNYYIVDNIFGKMGKLFLSGLVGVSGDDWKKQRKIISQSFHFGFIKENIPTIIRSTRELLDELGQRDLNKVLMIQEIGKISGEGIGRVFFSENLAKYKIGGNSITNHVLDTITNLGTSLMSVGYLFLGPKYVETGLFKYQRDILKNIDDLENTCKQILNDRKKLNSNNKDLAWHLLESQKNPNKTDQLSDDEIVANYVTFIMAGTSTTAHVVSMTLYALTQNPAIYTKLIQEIEQIYNTEDLISIESLNKMDWLSAVLKETLRVYNPAAIGPAFRTAVSDHKIGDVNIKKGTLVGNAMIFSTFDSAHFDNPSVFEPQRWLDKPNASDPYAYTPFWAGPRNCIGQHLATLQAKIILCELLNRFEFDTLNGYKLKMDNMKAYGPPDDLPMNLKLKTTKV